MKNSQLWSLLAVLAVTGGGATWMVLNRQKAIGGTPPEAGKAVLKDFRPADVGSVSIKSTDSEVTIVQKDGKWVVSQREDFPASVTVLNELRDAAYSLKVADVQKLGPSQLGSVQLIEPGLGSDAKQEGTLVTFRSAGGDDLASLIAGKVVEPEKEANIMDFASGGAKAQYVKVKGVDDYVFRAQDGFERLETKPAAWLDKSSFFKIGKIRSVTVTGETPDSTWKVERSAEGGPLTLVDPAEGEAFDPAKASGAGSAFAYVQFVDVAPSGDREKTGVDNPQRTAVIETFDGFTYTIKAGDQVPKDPADSTTSGDNYYMSYSVEGKFEEQRTPPPAKEDGSPGETEEEKKKADEDFAANLKSLKEKLAAEQAHKDRVFIVAKYALDPILKMRSEMMKDPATPAEDGDDDGGAPAPSVGNATPAAPAVATPPRSEGRVEAFTPPVEVKIPAADDEKKDEAKADE